MGQFERATVLADRAGAAGTPWALGLRARCRALLDEGNSAEESHAEAISQLQRSHAALDLARAHLLCMASGCAAPSGALTRDTSFAPRTPSSRTSAPNASPNKRPANCAHAANEPDRAPRELSLT